MKDVLDVVRRARALVFDFDGTLVDSNPIKGRAFEICFAEFPDRWGEILAYCRGHNHLTRGEKFQYVYEQILGLPYTEEIATVLHRRFAALSTDEIIAAPGDLQGPHDTLLQILVERGWRDYFRVIQGAPVDKATWLQTLREERGFQEKDVVFFGDTEEDASAALAAGCTFIGVMNHTPPEEAVYSTRDFTSLLPL